MAMCGTKKMKGGGLAMLSPAYALAKSIKSGKPEGLMMLSPLAQAMASGRKNKDKSTDVGSVTGMKSGGKVRKMAMGGKCRGMGSAVRGGKYNMA